MEISYHVCDSPPVTGLDLEFDVVTLGPPPYFVAACFPLDADPSNVFIPVVRRLDSFTELNFSVECTSVPPAKK